MDLKKIIKEEVNDFGWTEGIEPELKTFRVTYRMLMLIDAYDEEEAHSIFEGEDLGWIQVKERYQSDEPGVKSYEWYDTTSFDEVDD